MLQHPHRTEVSSPTIFGLDISKVARARPSCRNLALGVLLCVSVGSKNGCECDSALPGKLYKKEAQPPRQEFYNANVFAIRAGSMDDSPPPPPSGNVRKARSRSTSQGLARIVPSHCLTICHHKCTGWVLSASACPFASKHF